MTDTKKENNLEPKIKNKIIGGVNIIAIPLLIIFSIIGAFLNSLYHLIINKFKEPLSYLHEFKEALLEILSKNFLMNMFYTNYFMYQTGISYEHKNEFIQENPDFFKEEENQATFFGMKLNLSFLNNKKDDKKKK